MCRGSSTPRPADLQPIFRTEQRPQLPPRPPRGPIFTHDVVRAKPVAGDRSFENSSGRPSVAATSPRESVSLFRTMRCTHLLQFVSRPHAPFFPTTRLCSCWASIIHFPCFAQLRHTLFAVIALGLSTACQFTVQAHTTRLPAYMPTCGPIPCIVQAEGAAMASANCHPSHSLQLAWFGVAVQQPDLSGRCRLVIVDTGIIRSRDASFCRCLHYAPRVMLQNDPLIVLALGRDRTRPSPHSRIHPSWQCPSIPRRLLPGADPAQTRIRCLIRPPGAKSPKTLSRHLSSATTPTNIQIHHLTLVTVIKSSKKTCFQACKTLS